LQGLSNSTLLFVAFRVNAREGEEYTMSTKTGPMPEEKVSPIKGFGEYLKGVRNELRQAEWPSRAELIRLTQVVLTLIFIIAVFCGVLDFLLSLVTNRLFNR
jgi:preprotein translocase SecE subunit